MDRNILEEYQNRIQEVLKILEDNQEFTQDGVEESENKIESRLAELQTELEEAQTPIDMTDVGITSLGGFVRDRRESTVRQTYSDDREGYLLSEYDKRRVDPDEPTANVQKVVEQIRQEREKKQEEKREDIMKQMDSLTEKREALDVVKEFQVAKEQMSTEMKEAVENIQENIAEKMKKIEEAKGKAKAAEEEELVHAEALALYKGHGMNYTAPKQLLEECKARKDKANIRVARLNRKVANLQQDLAKIKELLEKIGTIDIDILGRKQQEDLAWEEHEAEQVAQEEKIQSEIEAAYDEKEAAERAERAQVRRDTKREVKEYYRGQKQGKSQENPQQEPEKPQQKPPKPEKPQSAKPPKPQKPVPPKGKWQIESVSFSIESGNNPIYKVIVTNGQETQEVTSTEVAVLDQDMDRDAITKLHRQLIPHAEKYYDKGLAIALQKADEMYQTDGVRKYIKTLQDKEIIFDKPDIHKPSLKIAYDFSGLSGKPNDEMKKLQKIAKANNKKRILEGFKARPNFLVRLIQKLFTKSLPEPTEVEGLRRMTAQEEMMARMDEQLENTTEKSVMRNWAMMRAEEGFDIEEFVKDMPEEEANKYRLLQDEYEESLAQNNPYKGFREKMRQSGKAKETPTITFEDEDGIIRIDPKDIEVLDNDDGHEM